MNLSWEEELKQAEELLSQGFITEQHYTTRFQEITGMDLMDNAQHHTNNSSDDMYDFLEEAVASNVNVVSSNISSSTLTNSVRIEEGVVHLQHLLSQDEQLLLYKGILDSAYTHTPTRARNPKSVFTKTIAFNCKNDQEYKTVPQSFKDYSLRATQLAHAASSVIPPAYKPDYITSFIYPVNDGRLTGHCDKVLGWVVLFSLGCTARFWIHSPSMTRRKYIDFESGDVLVFNGGTEFHIQHGIDEIVPNTCPAFMKELAESRVSLQLRQSERNDNKSWRNDMYNKKQYK